MPAKTVTMSENARSSYQSNLNRWIYPALGDVKLPEIIPARLSALLLSMQAQGKAQGTVLKVYTVLQGLFKMAYHSDTIPHNPMDKVDRPKPRKDEQPKEEEEKAYTAPELHRILQCLKGEPLKWRCYVSLVADTGVRRGEACGIQWADIDFTAGTITFRHNLQYTPAAGVYDTSTKGTVYHDEQVQGSFEGPVAYFRNGTGNPLVSYSDLALRWGISKSTVCRVLKKFDQLEYIDLFTFSGRHGTAIYLRNYLSAMFQVSDVPVDKDEVAMSFNIRVAVPEEAVPCVSNESVIVSKPNRDLLA